MDRTEKNVGVAGVGGSFQSEYALYWKGLKQNLLKRILCMQAVHMVHEGEGRFPPSPLLTNHAHSASFSIAYHAGGS